MKHVVLVIPGILSNPGDLDGWPDRAVTWLHTRSRFHAQPCEYFAGPLSRRWFNRQQHRAEKIAKRVGYYQRSGFRVSIAGHSNAGDITCRVCALMGAKDAFDEPIHSAHLFAPACHAKDVAFALNAKQVGSVIIHGSPNDRALKKARLSYQLGGWAGLGYGSLGLDAGELARVFPTRVRWISAPDFDHSTWLEPEFFEATMQDLAAELEDAALSP